MANEEERRGAEVAAKRNYVSSNSISSDTVSASIPVSASVAVSFAHCLPISLRRPVNQVVPLRIRGRIEWRL